MRDLDHLIARLDRIDQRHRWHRDLIELLDDPSGRPDATTEDPRPPRSTGIDLADKHDEVKRLVFKFGFEACRRNGWEIGELPRTSTSSWRPGISARTPSSLRGRGSARTSCSRSSLSSRHHCSARGSRRIGDRAAFGRDHALDAARGIDDAEARDPDVFGALLRYEVRMHPKREELRVEHYRVHRVRQAIVAAPGG